MKKALMICMTVLTTVQSISLNSAIKQKSTLEAGVQDLVMQYSDKAVALDIGGRMFEALKKANKTEFTFEEFKKVVKQWYLDHGNTYDSKQEAALGEVFKKIDKDKSNKVSGNEIRDFLFHTMDTNGDGVWNLTEISDFIHDYARMLHRNMSGNWTHKLKSAYDEINSGVSAKELENALSSKKMSINTFKDFIINHSTEIKGDRADQFEFYELILEAIGNESDHESINEEMFVQILKNYLIGIGHKWNDTSKQWAIQAFNFIDKNNDTGVTKKEIFNLVFTYFDRNGDGQLSSAEIKATYENYAKGLGRTLKPGWWNNTVGPAIKQIENGVSMDELWEHLEKHNQKITDFRHAVMSVSDPAGGESSKVQIKKVPSFFADIQDENEDPTIIRKNQ